jgi:recombination protein RecT
MLTKGIKALPSDVNSDRLKLNALMYIAGDKKLKELAMEQPAKIAQIVYNFIVLGLDMLNKECYIIPFGNELVISRDYKAERKLAKKYSVEGIRNIQSDVVFSNDEYSYLDGKFVHNYDPFKSEAERGKRIGSYCKITYDNGVENYTFISLDEIKRVKSVSKSANSSFSPWVNWESDMFKKTAIRKAMKEISLDFGNDTIQDAYKNTDNDVDFERKPNAEVIDQEEPDIIDVEVVEKDIE